MEPENPLLVDVEQALADARELEQNQQRIAAHALQGSWTTRLSMYAVGAILFTALFGLQLPPIVTAALGVIVVLVTVLGQQFRPDVKFINAKGHILQLRRMITTAEKELAAARAGDAAAMDPEDLLNRIHGVTDEVERSYHLDYAIMRERIVSFMPKDSVQERP